MKGKPMATHTRGYARHFEHRPEDLFSTRVDVIDAVVEEWLLGDLRVTYIEDVFTDPNPTMLVFGMPNTALVMGNGDGAFVRFAAYSLWRQPCEIVNITRNGRSLVQSGIWFRFLQLPQDARDALLEAMEYYQGSKFRTCVAANMQVMERAGFTSGKSPLSKITWPYELMSTIKKNGLQYNGQEVPYEFVRTTRLSTEDYARKIVIAQFTTPSRHAQRHYAGPRKTSLTPIDHRKREIAPALPEDAGYNRDLHLRISTDSKPAAILRQAWGPHALFEALTDKVDLDKYLQRALRPFPQTRPDLMTRIKKSLLFSRPIIWMFRASIGANKFHELGVHSEKEVYDMLRTHSDAVPNKYNAVIIRAPQKENRDPNIRIIIARITIRSKLLDWVLSKHVLMSGYLWAPDNDDSPPNPTQPCVMWAGELWKDTDGIINLIGNSGTYQPKQQEDISAVKLISAIFPNLKVKRAK